MRINLRRYAEKWGASLHASLPDWWVLMRGWILQADYSQIENRIITLLSGDELMVKLYAEDIDVHSYTAAELLGIDYQDFVRRRASDDVKVSGKVEAYRQLAKTLRYGMNYGGTAPTIWSQLVVKDPAISLQMVEHMCSKFRKLHAGIMRMRARDVRHAVDRDYLEAPLSGRRLHFHGKPDLTLIANWPMQTTGADIMNASTLRWDAKKRRDIEKNPASWRRYERLIAQVHDSLVVSTCNPFGSAVELEEAMTEPVTLNGTSTSFPIDLQVGANLGPVKSNPDGLKDVELAEPQELLDWAVECGRRAGFLWPAVW